MSDLQDGIALVKERIAFYQKLEGVEIPTVKEATKTRWKIAVDELAVQGLLHYDEEKRHADSMRIIPLSTALSVIREVEEEMVQKFVLDELDILFLQVAGKWKFAKYFIAGLSDWREIWSGLQIAWDIFKGLRIDFSAIDYSSVGSAAASAAKLIVAALENVSFKVIEFFCGIAATAVIAAQVSKVIRERDNFEARMRKRAFPQVKTVKRWPRRKVSRK